jgi:hypothetical protein
MWSAGSCLEHSTFFALQDWLHEVMKQTRGLDGITDEGAAAAASAPPSSDSVADSQRSRKKPRLTDEALVVFREVMSSPADRHLPANPAQLFSQLALSPEQIAGIIALLPAAAASEPSFLLLCGLTDEDLASASLSSVQIRAWNRAASKLI